MNNEELIKSVMATPALAEDPEIKKAVIKALEASANLTAEKAEDIRVRRGWANYGSFDGPVNL